MKTIFYDLLEVFHLLFGFVKPVLKPVADLVRKKRTKEINKVFLANAVSVLEDFDKCMTNNGIPYSLAFGTLLGAVRESGFIKHDLDIDTFVWENQDPIYIRETLAQCGFECIHTFLVENGKLGREETYCKNNVHVDVFYLYKKDGLYSYCCDFLRWPTCRSMYSSMRWKGKILARRIEMPVGEKCVRSCFENLMLPIPDNADELLRFRYGEDYMTPNPNWSQEGSYDKHIFEWPEVKATVQLRNEPWPYGM